MFDVDKVRAFLAVWVICLASSGVTVMTFTGIITAEAYLAYIGGLTTGIINYFFLRKTEAKV